MKRYIVRTDREIGLIHPFLHAHFAEHVGAGIYGGLWVGEDSPVPNLNGYRRAAIDYLRELGIPLLRWPGGCFADDYHWRDGIGPVARRPSRANASWGGIETNHFGTHEFIGLCRALGAEPYIAGNVGSGTPQELRDWVEYCNYPGGSTLADERAANGAPEPFHVRYWGVGNENWGCGGAMTPEQYADLFRRFAVYLRSFGGSEPVLIACGPNRNDTTWSKGVMDRFGTRAHPHALAMHYYAEGTGSSLQYTPEAASQQLASFPLIEQAIIQQHDLLNGYDSVMRPQLVLDEWGVHDRLIPSAQEQYGRLWQFTTMRGAVAVGLGLNIFNRQADKLAMCNLAQMVNVRASLLETEGPYGARCMRTPVYYSYALFKAHRLGTALVIEGDQDSSLPISVSASRNADRLVISLVNASCDQDQEVECAVSGARLGPPEAKILHDPDLNAYNSFDDPDHLTPQSHAVNRTGDSLRTDLPRLSVLTIATGIS